MSALSRRSLVASTAALPALAVPAAVSAAIEPDPIYAAIEAHRIAYIAWGKALKHQSGIPVDKDHPPQAQIHLYDRPKIDVAVTRREMGEIVSICASYPEEIEEHAPPNLNGAELDAWRVQKVNELHAEQTRLNEEFAQTPEGKLWTVANARSDEHSEAEQKLFDTTATTIHGLLALLAYIRTDDFLSQCLHDDGDTPLNLTALIERSLCKIAGLPAPPPWFDDEAV
jgi:hypothetical protein